jgi:myo-inositol-1-phosphate synthase
MDKGKTGIWFIGALGTISTIVMAGVLSMRKGLADPTGMITETDLFAGVSLVPMGDLVLGGCDIRRGHLRDTAGHLARETGAVDPWILHQVERDFDFWQKNLEPGTARNCGEAIDRLASGRGNRQKTLREEIAEIRGCLQRFRKKNGLRRVVVVNLASTEPPLPLSDCHNRPDELETVLDQDDGQKVRASSLYAYAAIEEGCPYVNFTPSNAALFPAMVQLAEKRGVPVMGSDGKTGETLVKSVLAPMFVGRNLEVLSWEGFNILGNMDGEILDHPDNRESKIRTKDQLLPHILGYTPHSRVHINFVPSLNDQKTAWDFIHFRGFLGVKMSLQFIWQGYDSILAAPLVLDLVRLADFAARQGECGLMPHLASFFKAPIGVSEHRFSEQLRMLSDYVNRAREKPRRVQLVK